MYNNNADLVTFDDLQEARKLVDASPHCRRTPLLQNVQHIFDLPLECAPLALHFKMENMQVTGSYKIRGVTNQLASLPEGAGTSSNQLVSYSAGNYGKAFAYMTSKLGHKALILMPKTAPENRAKVIESFGVETERWPSSELQSTTDRYVVEKNMLFCHSFDDVRLVAGHASAGLEILEDCPDVDVVIVPCGGGALLAAIASAIRLTGHDKCRVYGVEPEGACTMYKSLREGQPVGMAVKTIAAGLAPPFAGPNSFRHCKERVNDVLLVTDDEICQALLLLYSKGLVVEPSGAAGFAALLFNKVPDPVKGQKVVVVITGGNVTPEEIIMYSKST